MRRIEITKIYDDYIVMSPNGKEHLITSSSNRVFEYLSTVTNTRITFHTPIEVTK